MSSQRQDLHRALLRTVVIHTLRAAGFHATKPAVLETLTNIAERYLLLLAANTAKHALNSHQEPIPTLSDVRLAMQDCGVLIPLAGSAEEEWDEAMRRPLHDYAEMDGGMKRQQSAKRKRDEEDVKDVRHFLRWFDGPQHTEIKRVAGMLPDHGAPAAVGVGGGVVKEEDFLEKLKKRHTRAGDDTRLQGTLLGKPAEGKGAVVVEGGPVQHLNEWRPKVRRVDAVRDVDVAMSPEAVSF